MSRTYDIVCHDCKETLWIGQGWPPDRVYMYRTPTRLDALDKFLFKHERHRIEFGDDEHMDADDYMDITPDEPTEPALSMSRKSD